jgi:hypothetical protein
LGAKEITVMLKYTIASILAGGLLFLAAGCQRIHEPWVRQPEQLAQERARPDQAAAELRHRFVRVQTDR